MTSSNQTHAAVVMTGRQQPLELIEVPTPAPVGNEVKIRVEWTCSTPLDLHQADGGLVLSSYPVLMGDGVAGTVVETGPEVRHFAAGDKVFGFTWRFPKEKAHQIYCVAPENLIGKIPAGVSMEDAVTVPNNFVTVWHVFTKEFGFELPWPKPEGYTPPERDDWILIWGGSSSCGMYGLQVLKYYGYHNVVAAAGKAHHDKLRGYGAAACFDYREPDTVQTIQAFIASKGGKLGHILDCIGSVQGSVAPIAQLAEPGSRVAILLPVIIRDAAPGVLPEYEMDVTKPVSWKNGVTATGVRTHFYTDNPVLAERLQREIMPWALSTGVIEPNARVVVEGKSLLERAEKALSMLRNKEMSGARLVWRVAEE